MPGDRQSRGSQSILTSSQNDGKGKQTVTMLVMGLRGCGKSSFINSATGQSDCLVSTSSKLCTRYPRSCRASKSINECEFKFIDTPGFGDENIDDRKVFERLIEYLAPNRDSRGDRYDGPNLPRRITGLLYIHSEDEPFKSRASQKTIEMLVKILGEWFLDRVTVLVRSRDGAQIDLSRITQSKDSPLYPLYRHKIKPWETIAYAQNSQPAERILEPYASVYPRVVRLAALENFARRDGNNWQHDDIPRHLKEFFPEDIGPPVIIDQAEVKSRLQEQDDKIKELQSLLADKEAEIIGLQSARNTERNELEEMGDLLKRKEEEIKALGSTYDTKLATIREVGEREKFDHKIELGRLQNAIQEHGLEISKLKSSKDLELKTLERLKNEEISKLSSEKDLEIERLRNEVRTRGEELMKFETASEGKSYRPEDEMRTKENKVTGAKTKVNGTTTKTENKQGNETDRLRAELHRTSAEYASLRNHMQLEENIEQADITTALSDINRLVEEFGQGLSEHFEKYMAGNKSGPVVEPKSMLGLFGPVGSKAAPKAAQDPYLLFEYAIQATMCDQLYTHLFRPFHPSIAGDDKRNRFIIRLYEQMTYQEPQAVAGRWRKDTFKSISRDTALKNQDKPSGARLHRLMTEALSTLLGKVSYTEAQKVLKEHDRALVRVITKAEELNQLLKGGVSMLGDFQLTIFRFGEAFQPDRMSEVNSNAKEEKQPQTILATIGLGIVKRYALGGGQNPEETVLRKATVFGLPK